MVLGRAGRPVGVRLVMNLRAGTVRCGVARSVRNAATRLVVVVWIAGRRQRAMRADRAGRRGPADKSMRAGSRGLAARAMPGDRVGTALRDSMVRFGHRLVRGR